jgi:hypothetical protein
LSETFEALAGRSCACNVAHDEGQGVDWGLPRRLWC